jgi:hypothetical protein
MRRYRRGDGFFLEGTSPDEIVGDMWSRAYDMPDANNIQEYMRQAADNYAELRGVCIRCASAPMFVEDLVRLGEITLVKPLDQILAELENLAEELKDGFYESEDHLEREKFESWQTGPKGKRLYELIDQLNDLQRLARLHYDGENPSAPR